MESDSFLYVLLRKLPKTLFEMLHLPPSLTEVYRFDAVEVKKSYRLDGLFVPLRRGLPVYFVEFQMRKTQKFYPNLFAKVFTFLEQHDPDQDWHAVAIFRDRATEPKPQPASEDLLTSRRVSRIYIEDLDAESRDSPGMRLLELIVLDEAEVVAAGRELLDEFYDEPDCAHSRVVVELLIEVVMRRFTKLTRDEVQRMFKLYPIEQSVAYQEIREEALTEGRQEGIREGRQEGIREGRQEGVREGQEELKKRVIDRLRQEGRTLKQIAEFLGDPLAEVRRLSRR